VIQLLCSDASVKGHYVIQLLCSDASVKGHYVIQLLCSDGCVNRALLAGSESKHKVAIGDAIQMKAGLVGGCLLGQHFGP
jgi:hypothetical protein